MAKRTLSKIPSDILRRTTLENAAEKAAMIWICLEANMAGAADLSLARMVTDTGMRKNKLREAVLSLCEKNIIYPSDEFNKNHGGWIWWPEGAGWNLYFGKHSTAQWDAFYRTWTALPCTFTAFQFLQVLERQYQILPPLKGKGTISIINNQESRDGRRSSSGLASSRRPDSQVRDDDDSGNIPL